MTHQTHVQALEPRRLFATFTVTSGANSGAGTLRQAILDANATPTTADTINFNIGGGGVRTITASSTLPVLNSPIVIDGRTQPGYAAGAPVVRLLGPGTANAYGLDIGSDCAVYGLSIVNNNYAIRLTGSNNIVAANFLSLEPNGSTRSGLNGIAVTGGSNNKIGVAGVGGNVIACTDSAIFLQNTTDVSVQANLIGLNAAGIAATGSTGYGIYVTGNVTGSIGSIAARNTIAGLTSATFPAIYLIGGAGLSVVNNNIGTDPTRAFVFANKGNGITCITGSHVIYGDNLVRGNGGTGIEVSGSAATAIYGNRIFDNGKLGIDLGGDGVTPNDPLDADTGPNDLQNYPTDLTPRILPDGTVRLRGKLNTVASAAIYVDFYASGSADVSGFGEGEIPIGGAQGTTDAAGNVSFDQILTGTVANGVLISATSETASRTSEFSRFVRAFRPGDMDGNGVINNLDIAGFVLALTNPAAFAAANPFTPIGPYGAGDINDDGAFNNNDIAPFVALLTAGRPMGVEAVRTASPGRTERADLGVLDRVDGKRAASIFA